MLAALSLLAATTAASAGNATADAPGTYRTQWAIPVTAAAGLLLLALVAALLLWRRGECAACEHAGAKQPTAPRVESISGDHPGSISRSTSAEGRQAWLKERTRNTRISTSTAAGIDKLWIKYGNEDTEEMEEDAVRKMLQNGVGLSDAVCSSLLHLFHLHDVPSEKKVNKKEFEMVLAMLTHQCDTVEDQIDVCFAMFDTDGNGHLSRENFERMLQVPLAERCHKGR
eukprot:7388267-Prymnesium_polylepis.1